jgi:hypothetical protein
VVKSDYAFNPISGQTRRSKQTIEPQRINAALDITMAKVTIADSVEIKHP